MALFEPQPDELPVPLPVAPDASIDIIVCPHCEGSDCEVWDGTEARMATCPDCGAEFVPPVTESLARTTVLAVSEQRQRSVRQLGHCGLNDADAGMLLRHISR